MAICAVRLILKAGGGFVVSGWRSWKEVRGLARFVYYRIRTTLPRQVSLAAPRSR